MKKALCIILPLLITLSLFGCTGKRSERYTKTVYEAFDTVTTVVAYDTDKESFDKHFKSFEAELKRYDMLFSIYDEYDDVVNLREINERAKTAPVECGDEILDLLEYGKECYTLTEKTVNICMGSVLSLWHEAREYSLENPKKAYIPDMSALKEASKHTDINNLVINRKNKTVYFKDDKMSLDVGAIAKGFTAQRLSAFLTGVWNDYAVSIGGNVITSGYKNSDGNTKWNIEIENPDLKSKTALETLSVSNQSVVTSGSYQRFFTVNGKAYNHIIDPKTLMPAENFSGVTVVTNGDFALADALSTALFILDFDEGRALIERTDGAEALWADKNFQKSYSSGFENYIKR